MLVAHRYIACLIAITAGLVGASIAMAQQPLRAPLQREIRGVIKSVDAKAGAITITTTELGQQPGEKAFTLAKDAEIALGDGTQRRGLYKSGALKDLVAGSSVTLLLSDDEKTVASVLAQGPQQRGTIKSIDPAKKQIAISLFAPGRDPAGEEKSLKIASGAEIGIDDGRGGRFSVKEGKLTDLAAGMSAMLQLSADQKEVLSVVAEGPSLTGTVKQVADDKLTVTISPPRGDEAAEEKELEVAQDVIVLFDDGKGRRLSLSPGKLSELPTGAVARIRLSGDGKLATQIIAEGPSQGGIVKQIDAEKRTITVAFFAARDRNVEEKSLSVAADVRVVIDNAPAKLDDIEPTENGPFVNLRMSLDQQTVQGITIFTRR